MAEQQAGQIPPTTCGISSDKSRTAQERVEGIVGEVVPLIADHARLHPDVLKAKGRGPKPVAEARQLAMAVVFVRLSRLCAKQTSVRALVQLVGQGFDRDESTVRHAVDAVNERCRRDSALEATFQQLVEASADQGCAA